LHKLAFAASAAILALAGTSASAATYVDPWTTSATGGISVVFGNNGFQTPGAESIPGETVSTSSYNAGTGAFTDTFDFFLPDGIVGFTLSSIGFAANSSISEISMTFNGVNIPLTLKSNGGGGVTINGSSDAFPINLGASQRLVISGVAGPQAVYGSTATFERGTAAVPEPATWALMIGGFGGAGAMLRRRRKAAFA
jgi:hypothetical protein